MFDQCNKEPISRVVQCKAFATAYFTAVRAFGNVGKKERRDPFADPDDALIEPVFGRADSSE